MRAVVVTSIHGALIKLQLDSVQLTDDGRVSLVRLLANGELVLFDFAANESIYLAVEGTHAD